MTGSHFYKTIIMADKTISIWKKIRNIIIWLFIIQLTYIFFCRFVNPPITITQLVNFVEGHGLRRDYVDFDEMGRNIKLAVMASEDQQFPDHNGFDITAIKKAMKYNKKHPNKTRGASTITQQTAKNVFLWQHGGFFRKGLEVYFTFMIETFWNKKIILERYLNVAEMGEGIFGVQAAAQAYFHKNASQLSRKEAAMIAACLPNPKKFTVVPTSRYVSFRASRILTQMNNLEGDPDIEELLK
jgi:monofunctional biosynthetic peptidoglycan transglycosylase